MQQAPTTPKTTFRVHMAAEYHDIEATSAQEAREIAKQNRPGAIISKIKVRRDNDDE